MQLLCLGDIAIARKELSQDAWALPTQQTPGDDFRILFNWELPVGKMLNPKPRVRGPRLLSSPESSGLLKKWSPGFATIATNHILDAEMVGLQETIKELEEGGFATVGAGLDKCQIEKPLIWQTDEGRLTIINWVFQETHPEWMAVPGPNCWPGLERAKEDIKKYKDQTDWLMIVVHWSDELFPYPRPEDREIARSLASFGADLIVGHHPHVVRGMEIFGSCPVFYSLGNFYFSKIPDRKRERKIQSAPRNREGLGIEFTFKRGVQPDYRGVSFWYTLEKPVTDLQQRAVRRFKQTTIPLQKYQDNAYAHWYERKRKAFDRWGSRWHFGVLKRGVVGTIKHQLNKYLRFS